MWCVNMHCLKWCWCPWGVFLTKSLNWQKNGPMPMRVWFRQEGVPQNLCDLTGWEGKLYREYAAY